MATIVNMDGVNDDALQTPKQIRFINNQGQPPTKRRRINAACLTCRKRKTRCAGEHPTCSTCENNGHVCLGYSDVVENKQRKDLALADDYPDHDPDTAEPPRQSREATTQHHQQQQQQQQLPSFGHNINGGEAAAASGNIDAPHDFLAATPHLPPRTDAVDWEEAHSQKSRATPRSDASRPLNHRQASYSTEDGRTSNSRSPVMHHNSSDSGQRVPYFRYFGPTAIVPGFKQMVVRVNSQRRSSTSGTSPSTGSIQAGLLSMAQPDLDLGNIEDIPYYDPNDPNPVHPLILNLVETFFLRLGSTYPFLRRQKFPQLVNEKRVEPILVDAICALAARFSDIALLKNYNDGKLAQSEYGHVFAQRAKAATVDTFACPSVAAVQACLLMAYDGFGADQDSALWMYLGVAIRMAIDLGLPKEDGVKFRGAKDPSYIRWREKRNESAVEDGQQHSEEHPTLSAEEGREIEQERIDTFWAVFFLDRAISCGTGRPVTLKDDDFDLHLPRSSVSPSSKWPDPYASLIQIIHLNGRVSDVLNNIKQPRDLTKDKLHRLQAMENELTKLHQRMDARLRFDANNFQAHVKNGNGTSFILLHFWFHCLVIVLHQPTLLTSKGTIDRKHQLRPHSRELSMSSAKTIADILAFAELLDPRCFIGNPFTSQPIYVAACAFLVESKANSSQPDSRNPSPPPGPKPQQGQQTAEQQSNASSKHLLLASAALQNYQLCYKALKQMHAYWGGVHYILNVLDQKSNGEWDCETYTTEEYESAKQSITNGSGSSGGGGGVVRRFSRSYDFPASPMPETGPPLAWSLTGTTNSPNSSLTLLFQNPVTGHHNHPQHQHHPGAAQQQQQHQQQQQQQQQHGMPQTHPSSAPTPPGNMIYDPIRQSIPESSMYPPAYPQPNTSAVRHSVQTQQLRYGDIPADDGTGAQGKMGGGPRGPDGNKMAMAPGVFAPNQAAAAAAALGYEQPAYLRSASPSSTHSQTMGPHNPSPTPGATSAYAVDAHTAGGGGGGAPQTFATSAGAYSYIGGGGLPGSGPDLHLLTYDNETDIGQHLTSFEHTEMMSWFGDYFPNDVFGLYPGDNSSMG